MTTWEDEVRELVQGTARARAALDSALDAEKTVRASCQCGRKFDVPVKDTPSSVRAAEIWYRQGAELAKHLERLQEKVPDDEDTRPLQHWSQKQLVARARKLGVKFNPDGTVTRPDEPETSKPSETGYCECPKGTKARLVIDEAFCNTCDRPVRPSKDKPDKPDETG